MDTVDDHSASILFLGIVLLFVYLSNTRRLTLIRQILAAPPASVGNIQITPDGSGGSSSGTLPDWSHLPVPGG